MNWHARDAMVGDWIVWYEGRYEHIGRVEDIERGPDGWIFTLAHVPYSNEPPLATEDDIHISELGGIFETAEELAPFLSSPSPAVRKAALIAVGEVG